MTPERHQKLKAALLQRQPDLTLIADKVHKPRNLAALIRNADAVGMHQIHCVDPRDGYHHYRGTTLGSDRWVRKINHLSFAEAAAAVRDEGMKIYAAHFSDRAIDYRQVDYTCPCAILLGAEKEGVSDEAGALADEHIVIPMMGMVSSLNVSTAAGIILMEARNQRQAAGMYDQPRLSGEQIALSLFEWGNSQVAEFCRKRGLAYPPYDAEGEIIDPQGWNQAVKNGTAPTAERALS
ncbi:tRNA (guanosine(18)-2'-O)-methyltransferase TrmH [Marinobacterium jannaschii]|uniref:tRNA (guanosine(18)-2'-O)-methyltransferase TrmH n=1 Tax=Marinobacterium jannaschii TaxID=64970 RepID=UPI00047F596D|nr:tRNA (guanosine(18)-2'-O)-methyltransferase TrmH [Marinobacterium jannaschii]